jgi:hypothetical protein
MLLCCLRVIRPALAAFRLNSFVRYHEHFEPAQNDPDLKRSLALVDPAGDLQAFQTMRRTSSTDANSPKHKAR